MKAEKLSAEQLEEGMAHFSGSEEFYRHFTGMLYTEGIAWLAENAGAYWLIDLAGSYRFDPKAKAEPFQVWTLKVDLDKHEGVITMQGDTDWPVVVRQEIPYTDFPLPEFSFWVVDGTMMLKGEY